MIGRMTRKAMIFWVVLTGALALAQAPRQTSALSVQGCPGRAIAVQLDGRLFIDVQDLARLTTGSVTFEKDRVLLTLPSCDASKPAVDDGGKLAFSRPFMKAGIEAMASIREWGGMLMITVQNGYPVGNTMAGNTIEAFKGHAADNVALAASSASTDADYRGLELLKNEFNSVQNWADRYVEARRSLSAANLTMKENALQNDEEVQKMIRCGQFLAQMYAGGTFQDGTACR